MKRLVFALALIAVAGPAAAGYNPAEQQPELTTVDQRLAGADRGIGLSFPVNLQY